MYKKAAEFWAELRVELLSASTFVTDTKPNSSQLWRLYWANHQVVFIFIADEPYPENYYLHGAITILTGLHFCFAPL